VVVFRVVYGWGCAGYVVCGMLHGGVAVRRVVLSVYCVSCGMHRMLCDVGWMVCIVWWGRCDVYCMSDGVWSVICDVRCVACGVCFIQHASRTTLQTAHVIPLAQRMAHTTYHTACNISHTPRKSTRGTYNTPHMTQHASHITHTTSHITH